MEMLDAMVTTNIGKTIRTSALITITNEVKDWIEDMVEDYCYNPVWTLCRNDYHKMILLPSIKELFKCECLTPKF